MECSSASPPVSRFILEIIVIFFCLLESVIEVFSSHLEFVYLPSSLTSFFFSFFCFAALWIGGHTALV